MIHYTGRVIEVLLEPYQNASFRISVPPEIEIKAGQYILANKLGSADESIPTTCFSAINDVTDSQSNEFALLSASPHGWNPEDHLEILAPQGRPFEPSKHAERIMFWSTDEKVSFLLPLIDKALQAGCQVVLLSEQSLPHLSAEVEILPLENLDDTLMWCQQFIVHSQANNASNLLEGLDLQNMKKGLFYVTGEFPCGSRADCGLCTFRVMGKEIFPCKIGPLIPLSDLFS
jgi:hypothetical protein